ncbi:MFS transporter [Paraburkholderia sp. Ac-20340]|uniref:MFS transporter n=1 Tax=Paraburkholderia sp. Ac-20340 TaxID=2703888 RepID=UPI00197F1718|nr:MFS transporter [Paraburkholderia sp. Ac-20340]MBN3854069.1 MFS transporter [Paraburkholderia sp. Ac-20340]
MPPRRGSNGALVVAHVAGMIDLVALPVWVNTLIERFHFDAQRAGALATAYLACAVLCSVCIAPLFARLPGRLASAFGFGLAACGFGFAASATTFGAMIAAHAIAGAGVGCGLSVAHGAIGKTANPHRLFAMGHLALAVFGVAYFAAVPQLVITHGGAALFLVFVALSLVAFLALIVAWPTGLAHVDATPRLAATRGARLERGCWSAIAGIVFMAINQAMVFSFAQRIGLARGFGEAHVNAMLVAVGLVNMLPPVLAALLQRRFDARNVALAGPIAQAVLALVIGNATTFMPYALAASLWVFAMIFTHTFLFGLLAKLDSSGRAVAYTPAMLMAGSAVGPVLGGALIVRYGFGALGIAAVLIAIVSFTCFGRLRALAASQTGLQLPSAH